MIAFPDYYGPFLRDLGEKLKRGQDVYGSSSFLRSENELLSELQQEALDLAGWGYVLYAKIEAMKQRGEGRG